MALKIIGSGFGRTGTRSLKEAIDHLGFGPTHHMEDNFTNPGLVAHWQAIANGDPVDWDQVFAGYTAQIDWPGAHVWRELAAQFPEAKGSTVSGPTMSGGPVSPRPSASC